MIRRPKPFIRVEIAPLIDIIFILLIFFAVNTTLMINQQGLKLDLPSAVSSEKNDKGVVISIDPKGQIFVKETRVQLDQLQVKIKEILDMDPDSEMLLNSDKSIPYETIIAVLDQVRLAGSYNISLQTTKTIIEE